MEEVEDPPRAFRADPRNLSQVGDRGPLDLFQRISIDPASITVIRHGGERPTVVRVNDSGTPLAALLSARQKGSLLDRIRGRNGGAR